MALFRLLCEMADDVPWLAALMILAILGLFLSIVRLTLQAPVMMLTLFAVLGALRGVVALLARHHRRSR